jgi:hypothetical protein
MSPNWRPAEEQRNQHDRDEGKLGDRRAPLFRGGRPLAALDQRPCSVTLSSAERSIAQIGLGDMSQRRDDPGGHDRHEHPAGDVAVAVAPAAAARAAIRARPARRSGDEVGPSVTPVTVLHRRPSHREVRRFEDRPEGVEAGWSVRRAHGASRVAQVRGACSWRPPGS